MVARVHLRAAVIGLPASFYAQCSDKTRAITRPTETSARYRVSPGRAEAQP